MFKLIHFLHKSSLFLQHSPILKTVGALTLVCAYLCLDPCISSAKPSVVSIEKLRAAMKIPEQAKIEILSTKKHEQIKLEEVPANVLMRKVKGYANPKGNQPFFRLEPIEIKFRVSYEIASNKAEIIATSYLFLPQSTRHDLLARPLVVYCMGGMATFEEFVANAKETNQGNNSDHIAPLVISYFLQAPVLLLPKAQLKVQHRIDKPIRDDIPLLWAQAFGAKETALQVLSRELNSQEERAVIVTGISRGGNTALLLAAFDPSIQLVFSVSGVASYRDHEQPDLKELYHRPELLEQGIEFSSVLAGIQGKVILGLTFADGYVTGRHFDMAYQAKAARKHRNLSPIEFKFYHTQPGYSAHAWPLPEGLEILANNLLE